MPHKSILNPFNQWDRKTDKQTCRFVTLIINNENTDYSIVKYVNHFLETLHKKNVMYIKI